MQLSKRTQYGIRALICLCESYPRGFLQTRELARREGLPTKFLESILSSLTREKILISKIGATGGYRLARKPEDISVSDVISRLEGKKLLLEMESVSTDARAGEIAVNVLHQQLSQALCASLNSINLATLVDQVTQRSRGGQMYYI